ncbi:hypothetical protein ALON55S_08413 [Alishewanella longhuensis]
MHRLGGRSNSGEGGEDPRRFGTREKLEEDVSKLPLAAYGATPHYLVYAEVIQIKVAQNDVKRIDPAKTLINRKNH